MLNSTSTSTKVMIAWSEKYGRSEAELAQAMSLYFKLVNVVFAKSRDSVINQPLKVYFFNSANSDVIVERYAKSLVKSFERISLTERDEVSCKLNKLFEQVGFTVKLKASEKRGMCRSLSMSEYQLLSDFHYLLAQNISPYFCDVFELRDILWDLGQYYLIRDSLESGLGHSNLNQIAIELLDKKDKDFFVRGYPADLFVHDRVCMQLNPNKKPVITCCKDRISTHFHDSIEAAKKLIDDSVVIYSLA